MKWTLKILLGLLLGVASARPAAAAIVNGDFETGTTAGWGVVTNTATSGASVTVLGPGFAPNTNNGLSRVHGGNFAAELFSGSGDLAYADYALISQSAVVPAGSPAMQFWFAAVLNGTH